MLDSTKPFNMIDGFVKSSEVFEVLTAAKLSGQNAVLYGPGGYGKSEMTLAFLSQIGARREQITVKALSMGTTIDDLFGGINMKVLQEEGRLEYNLQDSVFSTPYLVLEEAFDAPLRVLEALKDTLTSGWVRNGKQQWKVATKFIIVATNRSKEELSEDDSSKALMERFPLSLKVEWDSHSYQDYEELIQVVTGSEVPDEIEAVLKYILESIKETSLRPPAPRTVVRMLKVHKAAGLKALRFMDGIPHIDRALAAVNAELTRVRIERAREQNRQKFIEIIRDKQAEMLEMKRDLNDNSTIGDLKSYIEFVENFEEYNRDDAENFDLQDFFEEIVASLKWE